jgi:hypothetical protein
LYELSLQERELEPETEVNDWNFHLESQANELHAGIEEANVNGLKRQSPGANSFGAVAREEAAHAAAGLCKQAEAHWATESQPVERLRAIAMQSGGHGAAASAVSGDTASSSTATPITPIPTAGPSPNTLAAPAEPAAPTAAVPAAPAASSGAAAPITPIPPADAPPLSGRLHLEARERRASEGGVEPRHSGNSAAPSGSGGVATLADLPPSEEQEDHCAICGGIGVQGRNELVRCGFGDSCCILEPGEAPRRACWHAACEPKLRGKQGQHVVCARHEKDARLQLDVGASPRQA